MALKSAAIDATFWMALKCSLGHCGQAMIAERVFIALRKGIMTCGKWKVGTDCSSVRVRYIRERHEQGAMEYWADGWSDWYGVSELSHEEGSTGGSALKLSCIS